MNFIRSRRNAVFLGILLFVLAGSLPVAPQTVEANTPGRIFLPLISVAPSPNPFGFDLRTFSSDAILQYGAQTNPKWARAGDVDWSQVEGTRGQYDWGALAAFDQNVQRLRAAGIEPIGIIQRSPTWAQSIPGRFCSPPKPEHVADFAKFASALAQRYSRGDLQVHYWEIWNEPDHSRGVTDDAGAGCWGNTKLTDNGGGYYGEVLKQIYPAIKAGNPQAMVFGGALASFYPDDTTSLAFLRGMLASGAGNSFDALSFHAYGEWSASDLLVYKTTRFRKVLREYNLPHKPLVATEIAATCGNNDIKSCGPNYDEWVQRQANYAARIYAEALALDLMGAFWYTLALDNPGFAYSHLIDLKDGSHVPRPAYYAFRNSAKLLQGARYVGPPLTPPTPEQMTEVLSLKFRKQRSTLYVLWVPQLDFPRTPYRVEVPPGATAICTQKLEKENILSYYCSDTDKDGVIWTGVISLPQYIEVLD
jgi:hypothetical protein